jgi:hypothetical protein
VSVFTFGSAGIFLALIGGDLFASVFWALILLFDPTVSTLSQLTTATGLQLLLVIAAFHCANKAFIAGGRSYRSYAYQALSWLFAYLSVFFNSDTLSVPATLYSQYLGSAIVLAFNKTRKKLPRHGFAVYTLGYWALGWGISLPFLAGAVAFLRSKYAASARLEMVDIAEVWAAIVKTPGIVANVATIALPFVLAPIVGCEKLGLIMVPGLCLCALLTLSIPILSVGEAIARRVVIAKVVLILAAGLRVGSVSNVWYVRGFAFAFALVTTVARVIVLRKAQDAPLPGALGNLQFGK